MSKATDQNKTAGTGREERSAFIALVGRPNVGKSSLLNRMLGQKVAIVSDKPQTTRTRIMGVLTRETDQLVFIDTPGFHKPRNRLGENMVRAVGEGLSDVEACVLVVEAAPKFKFNPEQLPPAEAELLETIKRRKLTAILAINKIDLLAGKEALLPMIQAYTSRYDFAAAVPLSAATGDGVAALEQELLAFTQPGPHFFADGDLTDQPDRVMVTEIIREKLLRSLDKEVPHGIAVGLERFYERDNAAGEPILEIEAVIYCERESHKGIIIGKKGSMLKRIGMMARQDIEAFFGCKVNLQLWVKVKEDWRNRPGLIHGFGLD
ncbi:MAG: GTPase Era [Clostridiales bacterium]|nr:GTPase Era [Clostridiales bacterium]